MASITEKIRSAFSVDTETVIADLRAKVADALVEIDQANEAHQEAALKALHPEATKAEALACNAAAGKCREAEGKLANLRAALAAAEARKASDDAGRASAAARVRQEARDAIFAKAHIAAAKLGQDLDLLVKSGNEFADAIEAMQSAFTAEEVGEHFGKALTAFPACIGWRLRRLGLRAHPFMDDSRAEWLQYLPAAEQVLGAKPSKVAA